MTNHSIHFLRLGVQVDFLNDVRPSFNNEFGVNLCSNEKCFSTFSESSSSDGLVK